MIYEYCNGADLIVENATFEKFLVEFKNFCESTGKKKAELEAILKGVEKRKKYLETPMTNGHYIDCVWSNPKCTVGPDTCRCHYREWNPRYWTDQFLDTMGIDYILWKIEEK